MARSLRAENSEVRCYQLGEAGLTQLCNNNNNMANIHAHHKIMAFTFFKTMVQLIANMPFIRDIHKSIIAALTVTDVNMSVCMMEKLNPVLNTY